MVTIAILMGLGREEQSFCVHMSSTEVLFKGAGPEILVTSRAHLAHIPHPACIWVPRLRATQYKSEV